MLRLQALVVSLVMTVVAVGLQAAEPTAEDLVARGLELRRQAKPQQALEMFRRAYALAPSARTIGQMGLVEASLERWLDAEAHLKASLAVSDDAWVKKNRGFLDQALTVSRAHLGELVITGPAATDVEIGGKPAGTLPAIAPIRLPEGDVAVRASGVGFKRFFQDREDRGRRDGLAGDHARPDRRASRHRAVGAHTAARVVRGFRAFVASARR